MYVVGLVVGWVVCVVEDVEIDLICRLIGYGIDWVM